MEPTQFFQGVGIYQCYCKMVTSMKFQDLQNLQEGMTDKLNTLLDSDHLCYPYLRDTTIAKFTSTSISFLISVINFFLRIIVVYIIKRIGYNQESQVTREIVTMIFISQYINTGIMLLITNGYFTGFFFQWLPESILGDYSDFTNDWYLTVGS